RRTVNPQVAGSSPAGGATFRNPVIDWVFLYLHLGFRFSLRKHPASHLTHRSHLFLFYFEAKI
ncbi:hypothetical protein, partial [Vibrio cholerae]|uniref:hypothetical protein n=1 Tax=Vibrio cholerae TaxID=666 RepID=UPI003F978452